ncbi:MAG: cell division protein FtsA [Parvularculaceae bacterium]|nr:MAG: cell division protein FtsA [Parvularculaceae bacterium]
MADQLLMKRRAKKAARRQGEIIAAVDIGGAKTACVIAALSPLPDGRHEPDVLGVGQFGGLRAERSQNGATDRERALRAAIDAAERMAGEQIDSAYVTLGGRNVTARRIAVDLDLPTGTVTEEDLIDCRNAGISAADSGGRLLFADDMRILLDGVSINGPSIGLHGDRLTTELLAVNAREAAVANAEDLMSRCALKVDGFIAAPYAAAEAVLIEDEKDLGVLAIDMGARTTQFAHYDRGVLVACGGVNVGGEHVTRDIAQIFSTSLPAAERIKTLHGTAIAGSGDEHRLLDFPKLDDPGEPSRHSRADLAAVIQPRLEETFDLVFNAACKASPGAASVRRVVLTGGGGLLLGALETAEKVMKAKARLGRASDLVGAPEAAMAPHFAAALGAIRYGARVHDNKGRRTPRFMGLDAWLATQRGASHKGGRWIGEVGHWLRTNF